METWLPYLVILLLLGILIFEMWQKIKIQENADQIEKKSIEQDTKNARLEAENHAKGQTIEEHRDTIRDLVSRIRGGSS